MKEQKAVTIECIDSTYGINTLPISKYINEYIKDGWSVVNMTPIMGYSYHSTYTKYMTVILEREVKEEQEQMDIHKALHDVILSAFDEDGEYNFDSNDAFRKDFEMLRSNFNGYNLYPFDDVENKDTFVNIIKMLLLKN